MSHHSAFIFSTVLAAAALVVPAARAAEDTGAAVTLATFDGMQLAGTFWAQKDQAPAVLLLHQVGGSKSDWGPLPSELHAHGFNVLALDFRGHGESATQAGRRLTPDDFADKDWRALSGDVLGAVEWLAKQPSVDSGHLSMVGASIGANLALTEGAVDKRVRTLVLLSPGLDYKGIKTERAMEKWGTRPVLLVASDGDTYSAGSVNRLSSLAAGRRASKLFKGAAHGAAMLGVEPTLKVQISGWLQQNR